MTDPAVRVTAPTRRIGRTDVLMVTCLCCSEGFGHPERRAPIPDYCPGCRLRARVRKCQRCREEFRTLDRRLRYCHTCRGAGPDKAVRRRECRGCGEYLESPDGRRRYCSSTCSPAFECVVCGTQVRTRKPSRWVTCSLKCGKVLARQREVEQDFGVASPAKPPENYEDLI